MRKIMNLKPFLQRSLVPGVLALALMCVSFRARANVYATNVKLNGGATNVTLQSGDSVTISYVLNEPASLGVTLNILSATGAVRSIAIAGNAVGARKGLNTVL